MSNLAAESDDPTYPYKSTGVKTATDPLRLDKGNTFKGNLHYTASFIPALALKGVKFDGQPNQLQQLVSDSGDEDEDGRDVDNKGSITSVERDQTGPQEVTIKMPKKAPVKAGNGTVATATTTSATSSKSESLHTAESSGSGKKDADQGVEMSIEQLVQQRKQAVYFFLFRSSSNLFLQNPVSSCLTLCLVI